ncbi:MAG TPA: flagellin [Stellaceae bacterium]|nr:flagellin [Stellaceae bacterium]
MSTIGTLVNANATLQTIKQLQDLANKYQTQVNTGLVSQDYSGLNGQAGQLTNLQSSVAQRQSFLNTITTVQQRITEYTTVVSSVETVVQQFAENLPNGAYGTVPDDIQSQAKQILTEISDLLNSQDGNRYIFAGSNINTPPVDTTGLPNPGTLTTSVSGPPPNGYYTGDDNLAQAKVDTATTIQYGVSADNPAFENAIRALNFLANLPAGSPSQSNPTDVANVTAATTLVGQSITELQAITGKLSFQSAQLNNLQTAHTNALNLTQTSIQNIETVDPATAITKLNQAETNLQASYSTISALSNLSLTNYLKF